MLSVKRMANGAIRGLKRRLDNGPVKSGRDDVRGDLGKARHAPREHATTLSLTVSLWND